LINISLSPPLEKKKNKSSQLKSFEGIGSSEACMYYHRAEYIYIYICAADIIVFFLHDKKKGTRTGNRHFPNTVLSPLHCIFVAKKKKKNETAAII
jgi:hypothetical protein